MNGERHEYRHEIYGDPHCSCGYGKGTGDAHALDDHLRREEVARLSALNERLAESFYLPLDCPNCGRRRLLAYPETRSMRCEKCGTTEFDCVTDEHESGDRHPQYASAWGAAARQEQEDSR